MLGLIAMGILGLFGAAQVSELEGALERSSAFRRVHEAHRQTALAARQDLLVQAWLEAGPAGRARLRRVLEESPDPPAGSPPQPWEALEFVRVAREEPSGDRLQAFADSIDLRVAPGFFPSAQEGRGEALTVHVESLWSAPYDGFVELTLFWIAPDGDRLRARGEPFHSSSFSAPGFRMFVRAPLSRPGVWRLVPQVNEEGRTADGVAVEVECVDEDLWRLRDRAGVPAELAGLLEEGHRSAAGVRASEQLTRLRDGGDPWAVDAQAPGSAGDCLVLLAPPGEAPRSFLRWKGQAAWRAWSAARGLRLVAAAAPDSADQLVELLERVRPSKGELRLVARGAAARSVHWLLLGRKLELDGILLSGSGLDAGPALSAWPTRRVILDAPPELEPGLADSRLVESLEAWLDGARPTSRPR